MRTSGLSLWWQKIHHDQAPIRKGCGRLLKITSLICNHSFRWWMQALQKFVILLRSMDIHMIIIRELFSWGESKILPWGRLVCTIGITAGITWLSFTPGWTTKVISDKNKRLPDLSWWPNNQNYENTHLIYFCDLSKIVVVLSSRVNVSMPSVYSALILLLSTVSGRVKFLFEAWIIELFPFDGSFPEVPDFLFCWNDELVLSTLMLKSDFSKPGTARMIWKLSSCSTILAEGWRG